LAMKRYDAGFYEQHGNSARRSAQALVPMLIEWLKPTSVVDIGCGTGAWLSVFREHGITDIVGIDGKWLDLSLLDIPESCFLRRELSQPIFLERRFDLVMSLEVAEHLPPENASAFVASLISLGNVVLFSAAIPDQGGRHHVNEQWPEYWTHLFAAHGFTPYDSLRPRIWNNPDVEWYYAQNILLFVCRDQVQHFPALLQPRFPSGNPLPLVHPRLFHAKLAELRMWIEQVDGLAEDLTTVIPPGASVIMVDEGSLGRLASAGYRVWPFPEKGGQYAGPPPDDEAALRAFERLWEGGAQFIVFAWPAFWWIDHYRKLAQRLRATFPVLLENTRAMVFDLRSELPHGPQ